MTEKPRSEENYWKLEYGKGVYNKGENVNTCMLRLQ